MLMAFCSKCGEKLPEEANFCPKCGARTRKGIESGASTPMEELSYAFSRMGEEMEKAFTTAAKEIRKALKTAREKAETTFKESNTCPNCGKTNVIGATFCYHCGKKIE